MTMAWDLKMSRGHRPTLHRFLRRKVTSSSLRSRGREPEDAVTASESQLQVMQSPDRVTSSVTDPGSSQAHPPNETQLPVDPTSSSSRSLANSNYSDPSDLQAGQPNEIQQLVGNGSIGIPVVDDLLMRDPTSLQSVESAKRLVILGTLAHDTTRTRHEVSLRARNEAMCWLKVCEEQVQKTGSAMVAINSSLGTLRTLISGAGLPLVDVELAGRAALVQFTTPTS